MKRFSINPFLIRQLLVASATGLITVTTAKAATWNKLTAGPFNWNDNANWDVAFPNATDAVGNMAVNLSANQTVNLNQAITVGSLTIGDNSGGQTTTLAPNGGSLTFDVTSGSANLIRTATGTGATAISSGITLNDNLIVSLASGSATSTMTLSGDIGEGVAGRGITKNSATLTLVLSGTNSYTGTTTIGSAGGMLQFAKAASFYNSTTGSVSALNAAKLTVNSGATGAFNVGGTGEFDATDISTFLGASTGTVGFKTGAILGLDTTNAIGGNFTYGSSLADPNGGTNVLGLTKLGTNTLTLTGANSYSGTTTISGGTLALSGGNNRIATAGTVNFSAAGTLDVGSTEQTLANMTVGNTITGTATGTTGGKLTLNGSLFALGGGTSQTNTLNLSGLPTFAYNNSGGTFRVSGVQNGVAAGGAGSLTLAAGTNTITASVFGIGTFNSSVNTSVNSGTVNLGTTNTINSDTITIGGNRGAGTLQYQSGNNTTLTLRGSDGTSRVTSLGVSEGGGPAISGQQGTVNLTSNVTGTSTLDAMITTLTIGDNTRASLANNPVDNTATFTMGAGTLDTTNLVIGNIRSGLLNAPGSDMIGTFTLGGGSAAAGTVKVGTMTLGDNNSTYGVNITATFNLNNGGTLNAQTIQSGDDIASGTRTRTINWNDGTIKNYDSGTDLSINSTATGAAALTIKLAATGTHTFDIDSTRTGTINVVLANATTLGTLAKAGSGTLTLNATNTYTGTTTVQQGTLALGASGTISNTLVLGTSGGTTGNFDVTSKALSFTQANVSGNGTVNIGSGKTINVTTSLAPGFSPGTLNVTGDLALAGTTTTTMELAGLGLAGTDFDFVAISGNFTLDGILNIISYGGYNLAQEGIYNLFDAATFDGDFDSVNVGGLGLVLANDVWSADSGGYNYSFDQNNGVLTVIPEPGAALLGGIGMLCLLRRRRN